jgi:hypothetical protein
MLLIGVERGVTKQGNEFSILHLIGENIDERKGKGQKVMTEFAYSIEVPYNMIGKHININYAKSYNGRAYVKDIQLID